MTKVVCISDTHMTHLHLTMPDGDILIHAGDATNRGTLEEVGRMNAWFGKMKERYKHILFVPGNHDFLFESDPDYARELMSNATVLIDEAIEIEGLKIYGSPWTPTFHNWAFMKFDQYLENAWEKIPFNLDILISHGPPYGVLDNNASGNRCGSMTLMKAVLEKAPRYHVFGHIHEGFGTHVIEPTTFINVAMMPSWDSDEDRNPFVIEVK